LKKSDDEDISIDLKRFGLFKKKHTKYYAMILFLLLPIILSIFLRVQPAYLPKTDEWARTSIYNNIKANIRSQVTSQYPNLPQSNIDGIVNDEFRNVLAAGTLNVNGQDLNIEEVIRQNSDFLKDKFQNEHGQTYLLAIDPYYYYRHTSNAVENGHTGDLVDDNGRYHDTKVLAGAPMGKGDTQKINNLHVYFQQLFVKIFRMFKPGADVMSVVFFTPVIIGTLAVIPAFFIARKIGGNIAGFFSGMIVAIHPAFLTRTAGGFSDTDAYNVLFPLIVFWFIIEAWDTKDLKKSLIFSSLAGLSVGFFAFAWSGWYFMFNFVLLAGIIMIGYHFIRNIKTIMRDWNFFKVPEVKRLSISFVIFFISSAIFVILFKSRQIFFNFIKYTVGFTRIKEVGTIKVWPNVYTTVAELNPANLSTTLSQISQGSKLWLFIGLLGLMLPLVEIKEKRKRTLLFVVGTVVWYLVVILLQKSGITNHLLFGFLISLPLLIWVLWSFHTNEKLDIKYSLVLAIWFVATIYASSNGVRFILLLVPAFAVSAGIAIGIIIRSTSDMIAGGLNINKRLAQVVLFALFISLLFFPNNMVKAARLTVENEVPSMNDDWYNTLTKIKTESEPDAIINSWWDFGHWFAAIADRAVTLDGGRQNSPQAHWLGKLMLTWDEQESVGILRYLDCGANSGFDTLFQYQNNDSLATINIVYEMLVESKDEARDTLKENGLTDSQANEVLQYTHCNPPENYFITSEDMVGKSGVWAHFGSWDFRRAVMYNSVIGKTETEGTKLLKDKFGLNDTRARNTYRDIQKANADQWIAPWPSYAGQTSCTVADQIVRCQNGVVFDLETEEATIPTDQGVQYPKAVAYIKDGEFRVKEYTENVLVLPQIGRPLGVALIPSGNTYRALIMDADLTASMFTRLFYYDNMDGGLKHFEKFHQVTDVTGQKIVVWKVDWEGKEDVIEIDPKIDSFAECVKESGAMMYGTQTCTWCNKQKDDLENSKNIPFVDCGMEPQLCTDMDVTSYPTWIIGSEAYPGYRTIEQLSELTGCQLEPEIDEPVVEPITEDKQSDVSLVKVQHILIMTDNRTGDKAEGIAMQLSALADEQDFESLIEQYSECSSDTLSCELGWFGRGVLPEAFEEQAFGLELSEVSEPFTTRYGYHIIKLIGTKE